MFWFLYSAVSAHDAGGALIGDAVGQAARLTVRKIEGTIWRRIVLANTAGVVIIVIDAATIGRVYPGSISPARLFWFTITAATAYFALSAALGTFNVRRRFRPAIGWLAEERNPTPDEQIELSRLPQRLAAYPLIYWTVLPLWSLPYLRYVVGYRPGTLAVVKIVVAFGLSAIVGIVLGYFLVEQALRPLLARAYAGAAPARSKSLGLFSRGILAWAAASGTPLVSIGVTLIGLNGDQRAESIPVVWAVCVVGAIAGIVVTAVARRAITVPLHAIRAALLRVEQGDLEVELPVDDGGELGLVESGFNRMVAGLRERERMRAVFGRHVGAEVAERALSAEFALGGELCEATTMFVDVIASTRLAQTRLPQDVVTQLNDFFEAVIRAVEAEGGIVNQFQGDGVLCVFGTPGDRPKHADCALRAARRLRDEIESRRPGGVDAAIGVSSGKVVAGNVGGVNRYEYTIVGDSVNEAARLTEQAKHAASRTLASRSTIELADDERVNWRDAGRHELRGRTDPTTAYEPCT